MKNDKLKREAVLKYYKLRSKGYSHSVALAVVLEWIIKEL